MAFTQEQINEIARKLALLGIKDSSFPIASALIGDESIPVLQGGENRIASISSVLGLTTYKVQTYRINNAGPLYILYPRNANSNLILGSTIESIIRLTTNSIESASNLNIAYDPNTERFNNALQAIVFTSYVNTTQLANEVSDVLRVRDVVDNLTSSSVINKPLSAKQGYVLDQKIANGLSAVNLRIDTTNANLSIIQTNLNTLSQNVSDLSSNTSAALSDLSQNKLDKKPNNVNSLIGLDGKIADIYMPEYVSNVYKGSIVNSSGLISSGDDNYNSKTIFEIDPATQTESGYYFILGDVGPDGIAITNSSTPFTAYQGDWIISNTTQGWAHIGNTDEVTGVKGNAESEFRRGTVNITSANILGSTLASEQNIFLTSVSSTAVNPSVPYIVRRSKSSAGVVTWELIPYSDIELKWGTIV